MRVLLQRVSEARVTVGDELVGEIGPGLLALVGVAQGDTDEAARWLADKTLGLRIFADADQQMNRSVVDVGGAILAVSQFTLAADVSRGRRPSFTTAAPPQEAERLYEGFVTALRETVDVATGRFGADMRVALVNDGPVTFLLERD